MKIKEGEPLFQTQEYVLVPDSEYFARRGLVKFLFDWKPSTNEMRANISVELLRHLDRNHLLYSIVTGGRRRCRHAGSCPQTRATGGYEALVRSRLATHRAEAADYHETRLSTSRAEPYSLDGVRPADRCREFLFLCHEYQSFATVGRVIRRATRNSSRFRGKPSAVRLWPRSLSALCARPCPASRGALFCRRFSQRSS